MTIYELGVLSGLGLIALIAVAMLVILLRLRRESGGGNAALLHDLAQRVAGQQERLIELRATMDGLQRELAGRMDSLSQNLTDTIARLGSAQGERLDGFGQQMAATQRNAEEAARALREELLQSFTNLTRTSAENFARQATDQTSRLDSFAATLGEHRNAVAQDAKALREELSRVLDTAAARQQESLAAVTATLQKMIESNERRSEALRDTVERQLKELRSDNEQKLESMRATVEEKLQGTLEQRLGASFNQVNENLQRVYQSVGEMQSIASGVGDLKRVLSNVKSRGTWGEANLGMLLEQVLTPEQYGTNVEVKPNSGQRVEFAIRLPGDGDQPVWLPIDAKLPVEDYERLVVASEKGDAEAVEQAARALERAVRQCAKDIATKYVAPPHSTDFAVMFLSTEGLFAEVVRRPGLIDALQREHRVVVTGPTTLMALLNSLRMGFRSLAIQQRSSEVWQVLGAVKTEFGKFGAVLDKVQKKLQEAQNTVEQAGVRRRAVDRSLRKVEALPEAASHSLLVDGTDALFEDA